MAWKTTELLPDFSISGHHFVASEVVVMPFGSSLSSKKSPNGSSFGSVLSAVACALPGTSANIEIADTQVLRDAAVTESGDNEDHSGAESSTNTVEKLIAKQGPPKKRKKGADVLTAQVTVKVNLKICSRQLERRRHLGNQQLPNELCPL